MTGEINVISSTTTTLATSGKTAGFAAGTRLLTPNGYVPAELLKPGDPVITRLGTRRPVRWTGSWHVETSAPDMRPVLVRPGALALGIPNRTVRLSPFHALFVDDVLVPVMHLINNITILREPDDNTATYFLVELDRHDVMIADGLPVESNFGQQAESRGGTSRLCAPFVTNGPKLERIRQQLDLLLSAF